jgi:hypothetical protein
MWWCMRIATLRRFDASGGDWFGGRLSEVELSSLFTRSLRDNLGAGCGWAGVPHGNAGERKPRRNQLRSP